MKHYVSFSLIALLTAMHAQAPELAVPKKIVASKANKATQLISPALSQDIELTIKRLVQQQTSSKEIAATPVSITKKPAESIKSVAFKTALAAASKK